MASPNYVLVPTAVVKQVLLTAQCNITEENFDEVTAALMRRACVDFEELLGPIQVGKFKHARNLMSVYATHPTQVEFYTSSSGRKFLPQSGIMSAVLSIDSPMNPGMTLRNVNAETRFFLQALQKRQVGPPEIEFKEPTDPIYWKIPFIPVTTFHVWLKSVFAKNPEKGQEISNRVLMEINHFLGEMTSQQLTFGKHKEVHLCQLFLIDPLYVLKLPGYRSTPEDPPFAGELMLEEVQAYYELVSGYIGFFIWKMELFHAQLKLMSRQAGVNVMPSGGSNVYAKMRGAGGFSVKKNKEKRWGKTESITQ